MKKLILIFVTLFLLFSCKDLKDKTINQHIELQIIAFPDGVFISIFRLKRKRKIDCGAFL